MKKVLFALVFMLTMTVSSQEKTIKLDYSVDYIIPSSRRATDTITVGFSSDGKYVWTNSKTLARDLGRSFFRRNPELLNKADLSIVLNTEEGILMMCFRSEENSMFFNFSLSTIVPNPGSSSNEDDFGIVSESTGETIEVLGKNATIYNIFPTKNVEDIMSVAFDESYEMNNKVLFEKVLGSMIPGGMNPDILNIDLPNGLIMKIMEKDKTVLEAIKINPTSKTININFSFNIKE